MRREWGARGRYTLGVQTLWQWDRAIFQAINRGWHDDRATPFWNAITWTGLGTIQAAILLLCLLHQPWRRACLGAGISGIVAGIIRYPIALWCARARPSVYLETLVLEPTSNARSFPSGHATGAFAIALFFCLVALRAGRPWFVVPALVWSTLVGLSRVYMGVHWPFDVVGAFGMGLIAAGATFWFMENGAVQNNDELTSPPN
jgi:membrane-associated phospholipid phosphatase